MIGGGERALLLKLEGGRFPTSGPGHSICAKELDGDHSGLIGHNV